MKFKKIILVTLLLLTVLTISSVSATDDNITKDVINIPDNNEPVDIIEEPSDIVLNANENKETIELNEKSSEISSNDETNIISSQDTEVLGEADTHSYKITIGTKKVYSNTKFTYTAKLTDNGKPVSGVYLDFSINDASNGWTSYRAKTNSNGIATFKIDPEFEGKYDVTVEVDDEKYDYVYAYSYIKVIQNPKAITKVKAPKVTAKYKANKYFKITVKNYKGKPIKKLKLLLEIKTGKKWKTYKVKTNNKGVAKFNTKKLSKGTHKVFIYNEDVKYIVEKDSKIIIKKPTAKKTTTKKTTTKKKSYPKPVKGKYGNKKTFTVTIKDGKKTIKVKCKYNKELEQYLGVKKKYGKRYEANICYERKNGMQMGKKGWWTIASDDGMSDYAKLGSSYNKYHPVTKVKIV